MENYVQGKIVRVPQTPEKPTSKLKSEDNSIVGSISSTNLVDQHLGLEHGNRNEVIQDKDEAGSSIHLAPTSILNSPNKRGENTSQIVVYTRRSKLEQFENRRKLQYKILGPRKSAIAAKNMISNMFKKKQTIKKEKMLRDSLEDEETKRVNDDADKRREEDRERRLEEQREIFRVRAHNFISAMHNIQGNRSFSEWKGSVVDSVVGAFLAQNVSDHSSSSAFMTIASKFPIKPTDEGKCADSSGRFSDSVDWDAVMRAPDEQVLKAIKKRGQYVRLGKRIQEFLKRLVINRGNIDLEWLRHVPHDEAREYLLKIFGFGLKSVECVSLLCLQQPAFPVDINVARVAVRLEWFRLKPLPDGNELYLLKKYPGPNRIHKYLWPRLSTLDQNTLYELHYQMITFGKIFCRKKSPSCSICPMREVCKHHASEVNDRLSSVFATARELFPSSNYGKKIVDSQSPRHVTNNNVVRDIEDWYGQDEDGNEDKYEKIIPTTRLGGVELKNAGRLKTIHRVYELPDSHPILAGVERRELEDPSPYLFVVWDTDANVGQSKPFRTQSGSRGVESSKNMEGQKSEMVAGTIMIPCRTAMKGRFPLNGTFFQVNEVFADAETAKEPMQVPRNWLWNLRNRVLYCGRNTSAIFKKIPIEEIADCFWNGFICVRAFNRRTRAPVVLPKKFHESSSKGGKGKGKRTYGKGKGKRKDTKDD